MDPITCTPIGFVRTPYANKYDAPRQPEVDDRIDTATVELLPQHNFEQALEDLDGVERIWLVTWFDRADSWKPKILTPRDRTKRGVFATRSPHRPNPIGLSCVRLISVKGRVLLIEGTDLLDGTPVLDIKPYIPYADAFPESAVGWLADVADAEYTVVVDAPIPPDAAFVVDHARRVLSFDPHPHPYRRTRSLMDGTFELALQQWRCAYVINNKVVTITAIVLQS